MAPTLQAHKFVISGLTIRATSGSALVDRKKQLVCSEPRLELRAAAVEAGE